MIRKYAYVALILTHALDSATSARVKIGALVHENGGTLARASQVAGPVLDQTRHVQNEQGLQQHPNSPHANDNAALDTVMGSISDPAAVAKGMQGEVPIGAKPTSAMIALSAATSQVASSISRTGLELIDSSSKSLITLIIVACIIVICCCLGSLGSPDPSEEQHGHAHGKQRPSVDSTGSVYSRATSKSPQLGGLKAPSGDSPPALTASWLSVNRERGAGEPDNDSSGGESAAESVRSWMSGGGSKSLVSSFASSSGHERKRDVLKSVRKKAKGITKAGAESRGEDPANGYQLGDFTRGLFSKAARHLTPK